jgi:uncharacterized protein (TIGR00251 family)
MLVRVQVIPRSKKSTVIDIGKGGLKVKVLSPPIDNQANNELIQVLAQYYNVKKSSIKIKKGMRSRNKLIEIEN